MCKYRIAKKKIKSTPKLRLFIKSHAEWVNVWADSIIRGERESVGISLKFADYTLQNALCLVHKNKLQIRHLKLYSRKTFGV